MPSTPRDPAAPVGPDGARRARGTCSMLRQAGARLRPQNPGTPDSCGKDRHLPARQAEAPGTGTGPVPQLRPGAQQRQWPQTNAASGRTGNREGKPPGASLQALAAPVHFHVRSGRTVTSNPSIWPQLCISQLHQQTGAGLTFSEVTLQ